MIDKEAKGVFIKLPAEKKVSLLIERKREDEPNK